MAVPAFAAQLADPGRSVASDLLPGCPVLVIAFGAIKQRLTDIAPYEFLRQVGVLEVSKVFCRDPASAWYHRGIPGAGAGIDGLAAHLRGLVDQSAATRVVTLGASAGGYAALLLGRLIGAHVTLAFAPQTSLEPATRHAIGDQRFDHLLDPLLASGGMDRRYADLRSVFLGAGSRAAGVAQLHFADRVDAAHAHRLAGLPGVELHDHGEGGHNIAGDLLTRGELRPILLKALG